MLSEQPILFIRHAEPIGTLLTRDGANKAYDFKNTVHPAVSQGISEISRKILNGSIVSLGDISNSPIIGVHSLSERATQTAQEIMRNLENHFAPKKSSEPSRIRVVLWLPESSFYGNLQPLIITIRGWVQHLCDDKPLIIAVWHKPALEEADLPHGYCEGAVLNLMTGRVLEKVSFSEEDIFHGLAARYGKGKTQENAEFQWVHRCNISQERISDLLNSLSLTRIPDTVETLKKYQHFDLVFMEPNSTITPHKHHTEACALTLRWGWEISVEKEKTMVWKPSQEGTIVVFESWKWHALKAWEGWLLFLAGSVTPIVEWNKIIDLIKEDGA